MSGGGYSTFIGSRLVFSGSSLEGRIAEGMTNRLMSSLNVARKLLLATSGLAAVASQIVVGLMQVPQARAQSQVASRPAFEAASIKPDKSGDRRVGIIPFPGGRLNATNVTVKMLIRTAYRVQDFQILGGPSWLASERYDVEAKAAGNASNDELWQMLQTLLADRFQLALHRETKELPIYALTLTKGGPKFKEAECIGATGPSNPCGGFSFLLSGQLKGRSAPISQLALTLSTILGRRVVDETGLAGKYDIDLQWTPDESIAQSPIDAGTLSPETNFPSLTTALQEQIGLKLVSEKGPVEVLVIEHAEKASEN